MDYFEYNGAYTITNQSILTIYGGLNANNTTGAQFVNQGTLNYEGYDIPMPTGSFNCSFGGNTVNYSAEGNQAIRAVDYHNLIISNGYTKTLQGNTVVNGTLTLTEGLLDLSGSTLTISGTGLASCSGSGSVSGDIWSSFIVNSNSASGFPKGTYYNVTINSPGGVTLCGNATVSNHLALTQGMVTTGSYIIYLSNNTTGSLSYGTSSFCKRKL